MSNKLLKKYFKSKYFINKVNDYFKICHSDIFYLKLENKNININIPNGLLLIKNKDIKKVDIKGDNISVLIKTKIGDKIIPIIRSKGDITDLQEGRDLIVSLSLNKAPNGREYTSINSIIQEDKSPLHTDPEVANEWVNHDETWRDVYSIKPLEYLQLVAMGETPVWSKEASKFVSKNEDEGDFGSTQTITP